jgi:hypothetical protein
MVVIPILLIIVIPILLMVHCLAVMGAWLASTVEIASGDCAATYFAAPGVGSRVSLASAAVTHARAWT